MAQRLQPQGASPNGFSTAPAKPKQTHTAYYAEPSTGDTLAQNIQKPKRIFTEVLKYCTIEWISVEYSAVCVTLMFSA